MKDFKNLFKIAIKYVNDIFGIVNKNVALSSLLCKLNFYNHNKKNYS